MNNATDYLVFKGTQQTGNVIELLETALEDAKKINFQAIAERDEEFVPFAYEGVEKLMQMAVMVAMGANATANASGADEPFDEEGEEE
jgi:hypothetical protein